MTTRVKVNQINKCPETIQTTAVVHYSDKHMVGSLVHFCNEIFDRFLTMDIRVYRKGCDNCEIKILELTSMKFRTDVKQTFDKM